VLGSGVLCSVLGSGFTVLAARGRERRTANLEPNPEPSTQNPERRHTETKNALEQVSIRCSTTWRSPRQSARTHMAQAAIIIQRDRARRHLVRRSVVGRPVTLAALAPLTRLPRSYRFAASLLPNECGPGQRRHPAPWSSRPRPSSLRGG